MLGLGVILSHLKASLKWYSQYIYIYIYIIIYTYKYIYIYINSTGTVLNATCGNSYKCYNYIQLYIYIFFILVYLQFCLTNRLK